MTEPRSIGEFKETKEARRDAEKEDLRMKRLDAYHDHEGRRIRLDTEHLQWCAEHPLDREKAIHREERRREVTRAELLLRGAVSVFCGWFVFNHILDIVHNGMLFLTGVGVIAGMAFIAWTIADAMDAENNG